MCHPSLQPQQQPGGPASGCSKLPFLVLSAPTYQAPEHLQHKKTFTTIILKALRRFSARGGETCGYPNRQSLTQKGSTLGLKESEDTQPYQNSTASVDPDTTIARCGKSGPSCTVLSEGAPAHCAKNSCHCRGLRPAQSCLPAPTAQPGCTTDLQSLGTGTRGHCTFSLQAV